jgi:hypothetical protein
MRSRLFVGAAGLLILAGCAVVPKHTVDPFTDYGKPTPYFEMQCTKNASNGDCLQASCKADKDSDCTNFVLGCFRNDGAYSGTAEGGTCTKIL